MRGARTKIGQLERGQDLAGVLLVESQIELRQLTSGLERDPDPARLGELADASESPGQPAGHAEVSPCGELCVWWLVDTRRAL